MSGCHWSPNQDVPVENQQLNCLHQGKEACLAEHGADGQLGAETPLLGHSNILSFVAVGFVSNAQASA